MAHSFKNNAFIKPTGPAQPNRRLAFRNSSAHTKPVLILKISVIAKYLGVAILILFVLNALAIKGMLSGWSLKGLTLVYFDRESNIPSYFSSLILLWAASMLGLIAALKKKDKDPFTVHWIILALIFLGMSVDEMISLHEHLIDPMRHKFQLTGLLRFSWVIAGGLFLLIFGLAYLKFFLALPKNMKVLFFASGFIYVLGAIGFEMIGGSLFIGFNDFSAESLPYLVIMTIEETLEMSGIGLFIYTLLQYLKTYQPNFRLTVA